MKFQMLIKKNKEIVVGSNNDGKIEEIKDLLPNTILLLLQRTMVSKAQKKMEILF